MKRSATPPARQMNLLLLGPPAAPCDQQKELTLALVELLIGAAQGSLEAQASGEENESPEAHA